MRNLFIELHECRFGDEDTRFASGWEDLFTEQLAFLLSCDRSAANALAAALLNDGTVEVGTVELQPTIEEGSPDLALHLRDGRDVLLEHKIEAVLQPRQLERYLRHGFVALVSRRSITVAREVLEHDGYLRTARGEHFTWEDVFRALPLPQDMGRGQGSLCEAFRSYMRELGLAPTDLTHKWRRLFEERTELENRLVQKEFGRLLRGVAAELRTSYRLRVTDVSHKGNQARAPQGASWRHLRVHPVRLRSETVPAPVREAFEPGYEALSIEVVFDDERSREATELLQTLPATFEDPGGHRWHRIGTSRIGKSRQGISVATPLVVLFRDDAELEERVHGAAKHAVEVVLARLGLKAGNTRPN